MPHIFVSYAKKDTRELAETLVARLNAVPTLSAWMDNQLVAGTAWAGQIQSEIDRCDFVVALLSPDVSRTETETQPRSFVLHEIDYARRQHKTILPVIVQTCKIPIQLEGIQNIDLTGSPTDPTRIIENVCSRFNTQVEPESMSTPIGRPASIERQPSYNVSHNAVHARAYMMGQRMYTFVRSEQVSEKSLALRELRGHCSELRLSMCDLLDQVTIQNYIEVSKIIQSELIVKEPSAVNYFYAGAKLPVLLHSRVEGIDVHEEVTEIVGLIRLPPDLRMVSKYDVMWLKRVSDYFWNVLTS